MRDSRWLPYAVLGVGVLIASTASILIRFAQGAGAPSLSIAAYRLGIAALVLLPIAGARKRDELAGLGLRDLALALASGAFLALHFWTWIRSLEFTSVASSTALVTTNPVWVGLASLWLLRERVSAATIAGIVTSLGGTLLIFAADSSSEQQSHYADPLRGNALALAGAVAASGYLLIGRALRARVTLLAYVSLAYSWAAALLWLAVWVTGTPVLGLAPLAYLCVLALALGPQLLGHTAFNWSLRRLSATFVALSILGEPVGSAALALLVFGERVSAVQLAGFVLILCGIFVAARAETRLPSAQRA